MYILGINGGVRPGYQDIAACLIKDGQIICAVEEERLNRIKFSPGQLPELAINECLKIAGISICDVDFIASHGITWGEEYAVKLRDYLKYTFGYAPPIEFVHHHDAHAASAFYGSGFDKAMVITLDASGDGVSTQFMIGEGDSLQLVRRIERPNSLGIFYSLITQFCGFRRDSDEYKLMGLAAYGDKNAYDLSDILSFGNGEYRLNENYLKPILKGQSQPLRQEMGFSDKLINLLGNKRLKHEPIEQKHKDIAASAQKLLEDVIVEIVTNFNKTTGLSKICLAGGVSLNCLANQKIMNLPFIDDIYIQPAASDAGVALGAAMQVSAQKGIIPKPINSALLGPEFTNEEIEKALNNINVKYKRVENIEKYAAALIYKNKVVAWFQDKLEFGPRALGARSILANPAMPDVKNILNKKIKFRESYRPFCPSVTLDDFKKYFKGDAKCSPFMNITFDVRDDVKKTITGVVHIDGTARIQTVDKSIQPLYYKLLKEFENLSGFPVIVNTSFNTNNEPIVANPYDAVSSFYRSGIDVLIIGNFIIEK
jgi:carbamoyltransferase